ncbi:MAG: hypothetical protein IT310_09125 [Anaerolineales bacterium]|nr:hypothetical protein [Anaerolineales bacterium]
MIKLGLAKALHRLHWPIILILTLTFTKMYLAGMYWEEPRLAFSQMLAGTADKPFVYRVFVPLLVKIAVAVFPLPSTTYASFLIYILLVGFVICVYHFSKFYWKGILIHDFVAYASILFLIPFTLTNRHIYDFSALFLFTLALLLMAQNKWTTYFCAYICACLNKETAILLPLVFLIHFRKQLNVTTTWKLFGWQIAIYSVIRFAIMLNFRSNPGTIIESHILEHFSFIQSAPVLVLGYVVYFILIAFMIKKDFHEKPSFLREAFATLLPVMFILYLLGGSPFEIRVFYEVYPVLFLLAIPTFGKMAGFNFRNTTTTFSQPSQAN